MTRLRTSLKSSARPWFALAVVLTVAAFPILHDTAQGVVVAAAMFTFFGACIRSVSLAVRDNPVSAQMLAQRDIIHGSLLSESADASRRRRGG
jgi:cytochrome bd-type quinol oxidase subunit 2